jgi:hypothetical protein
MRKSLAVILGVGAISLLGTAVASATPSPNGPGQPGAPGFTCPSPPNGTTPGNSVNANGSPFNPGGQAGAVYAGNPGTASLNNSNSSLAVSQYDVACFQASQHQGSPH